MNHLLSIKKMLLFLIFVSLLLLYYYRFTFVYPFAATWDQVDFVLALEEFDVLKMQPHFPGYPYFILGGVLFAKLFHAGPESFTLFNHFMMLSSCIPIYFIAREWLSQLQSFFVILAIQSISYVTVMVSQPMSEGAALAVVFWFLWSILLAKKKDSLFFDLLPFFLYSILLGIRLSYIAFGIGLIFHLFHFWKRDRPLRVIQLVIFILLAIMFQFIWIGALAVNVGGFSILWAVATGFSEGHFTEWGGTAEEGNIIERIIKLLFINILWVGLSSENIVLLILFLMMLVIVLVRWQQFILQTSVTFYYLLVTSGCIYFIWVLIAQNIEKPRHSLPIVLLLFLLITIKLLHTKLFFARVLLVLWIGVHGWIGFHLLEKQATELPAVYQLEEYLRDKKQPFVIYTWEETRIFEYLQSHFTHKRVYTYGKFMSDVHAYTDRKIYVTGQVIEGFEAQGFDIRQKVKKRMEFQSDPLFDPIYAHIELYEWVD